MGIDIQGFKHLLYCKQYGSFKDTLTIGRQELHIDPAIIKNYCPEYTYKKYCEHLLIYFFGSTFVDSIDNSNYENASIIFDMNNKINTKIINKKYDTIIDYGTLEHIYHINNALYNISALCKTNGQIIHILPSNGFNGHGFWQMSPELFFSLYSEVNGYTNTELFIMDTVDLSKIDKLSPPKPGQRLMIQSSNPIYIAVKTNLYRDSFNHDNIQQSDYNYIWNLHKSHKRK
jgi:hypothetical protein